MKAKRKKARRFLIARKAHSQSTTYGREHFLHSRHPDYRAEDYCDAMLITEAKKAMVSMASVFVKPGDFRIYELVPAEAKKRKKG